MRKSYFLAAGAAVAAAAWIASGQFAGGEPPQPAKPAASQVAKAPQVRVRTLTARSKDNAIVLLGRTEASRSVVIKAETSGMVAAIAVRKGERVKKGDVILRIALDDRKARLSEAEALVRQRSIEYEAAKELSEKNYRSKTKLAESMALLEAAQAGLERIKLDIDRTVVRAPFTGVLDTRPVEVGDYIAVSSPVATVVDLDPILVVGAVTEREIEKLRPGGAARAKLVTGQEIAGTIRYVSTVSESTTRTFKVEIEAPNADSSIPSGMTAELRLSAETVMAHLVSPAVLTLSEQGEVGIKTVGPDNRVRFHPIELVDDTPEGVWLGGLPETVTVITVGQEFVRTGQTVVPVPEESAPISSLDGKPS